MMISTKRDDAQKHSDSGIIRNQVIMLLIGNRQSDLMEADQRKEGG
jgi:hypothetical protein